MNQTSVVHDGTTLRVERIRPGRGYRLSGEIDLGTHDVLTAALARLDGPGDIHLDLSSLEFCDAAGLGAMVTLAERVWPAGRVVLDGVSRQVCRMLAVLHWDLRPNLVVHPRAGRPAPDHLAGPRTVIMT